MKINTAAAAALICLAAAAAPAGDKAAEAYLAGNMKVAAGHLEKEIGQGNARSSRYLMLGRIYFNQERWKDAESILDRLLEKDPEHPQGNELLARVLLRLEKFDKAIPLYESSIRETGRCELRLEYAKALTALDRKTDAVRVLKKLIMEKQTVPEAHFLLGRLRLESATGRWASQQLWTAHKLGFRDRDLEYMLASSFFIEGRVTGPLRLVGPLEGVQPGQRTAEHIIVRSAGPGRKGSWYASGPDTAIYQAEAAVENAGDDRSRILAARCWLTAGNTGMAARHVSSIKKTSDESRLLSAEIAVRDGDHAKFLAMLDDLLDHRAPIDTIMQLSLDAVVSAQAKGEFKAALELLERVESADPGRSDTLRLTIDVLSRLDMHEKAREKARLLSELHPDSPDTQLIAARFRIIENNEEEGSDDAL